MVLHVPFTKVNSSYDLSMLASCTIYVWPVLSVTERRFLKATASLGYSQSFPARTNRMGAGRAGRDYLESEPVWSVSVADPDADLPNIVRIYEKLGRAHRSPAPAARCRTGPPARRPGGLRRLRPLAALPALLSQLSRRERPVEVAILPAVPGRLEPLPTPARQAIRNQLRPAHVFACFHQIQRAFQSIFDNIIGSSMPAARLRASIWQSIFTHDMRRYRRILYRRMGDFPTLITGPSGTGKELVARAIAGVALYAVPSRPDGICRCPPGETFLPSTSRHFRPR